MTVPKTAGKRYIVAKWQDEIVIVDTPAEGIKTIGMVIARCPEEGVAGRFAKILNDHEEARSGQRPRRVGLVTTRELLEEVAVRMEIALNSTKGRELGSLCRQALENLDSDVLNYYVHHADA